MVSTVKSRRNYYEVLGLTPAATDVEISQAFAAELRRPRAFGGLAEVGIAYETLRDPLKRRDYDASLGLTREPEPQPWLIATARPSWAQLIAPVPPRPAARPSVDVSRLSTPPAEFRTSRQAPSEPRPGSFIAASLRGPVGPVEREDNQPDSAQKSEIPDASQAAPKANPEYPISDDGRIDQTEDEILADVEHGPIAWKRTIAVVGGLVLAVGVLGAWAGLEAGNDGEAQQQERAVTVALPQPKALPRTVASSPAPAPAPWPEEARSEQRARAAVPARRIWRAPISQRPLLEEQQSPAAQAAPSQAEEIAAVQGVAESQPAASVPASLSLPNAVIARTISRIGYPCGQVASTSAADAPGVFKVTCTSGHSYRAAPVGGRYHFKRWNGR